ncbi:MAG: AP2 domain-containing protein, partial [Sedimentisphaerales bacterium]
RARTNESRVVECLLRVVTYNLMVVLLTFVKSYLLTFSTKQIENLKFAESAESGWIFYFIGDKPMYHNVNVKIYVPNLLEKLGIIIILWLRKKIYGYLFRRIKLTQGKYAKVDPEDFKYLNLFKWFAKIDKSTYYAARIENGKKIYMHRQIMRPMRGLVVDHINHKGFDNRKDNLKIVTIAENNYNSRKTSRTTTSIYKGVSKCKKTNKWRAVICANEIDMHLGYFDSEIEAAKTYDEAAKKYRGEFAALNFSHPDEIAS